MKCILIAGIGNIFFGDDAFGCEVAAELLKRDLPKGITVVDFGIRGYDLAYAMMDGFDATILVDASPRGEPPGTVYMLEIDPGKIDLVESEVVDGHDLTPVRMLQLVRSLGGDVRNLFLVGCEPEKSGADGEMRLSDPVQGAIKPAAEMVLKLAGDLLGANQEGAPARC